MPLTEATIQFDEQQVLYAAAAALTWLCWDVIVHWDIEIQCIWQRPRLWVKCLYFFMRYVVIFHEGAVLTLSRKRTFSTSSCRGWIYYELIFAELLTFVVEVLLVMRLYVLYRGNKVILALVVIGFTAEIAIMASMLGISLPQLTFRPDCLVSSSAGIFMLFWLSSLVFETFLFGLTLYKFYQSIVKDFGKHSILFIFVRDGTWAFTLIFVAMLLNLLMYKLEKNALAGMGYYWALSVMSFSGSHILLNLRSIGIVTTSYATSSGLPTTHDGSFGLGRRPENSDWRTYFTTGFDLDGPLETVELMDIKSIQDATPSGSGFHG